MITRRSLILSGLGFISSAYPIAKLLEMIINSPGQDSFSRFTSQPVRNYVQFNLYGGPTRWSYDHFLKPYDQDPFVHHPMVVSENLGENNFSYETFKHAGINIPSLWKNKLITTSSNEVPMTNLLNNMMTIRGVNLEGSMGHPVNCSKMVAPKIGGISLDGLIADKSTRPFGALTLGNSPVNRSFKSKHSTVSKIPGDSDNYLKYMLEPFFLKEDLSIKHSEDIDKAIEDAITTLKISENEHPLHKDLHKARKLFRESIDGLISEYDDLVEKYSKIIDKSLNSKVLGVNDKIVTTPKFPFQVNGESELLKELGKYHYRGSLLCDDDLCNILKTVENRKLAEEFALVEYVITHGLCSSIVISPQNEIGNLFDSITSMRSLPLSKIKTTYDKNKNQTTFSSDIKSYVKMTEKCSLDSHTIGSLANFLTSSMFFYTFSGCLNELISVIKTKNNNNENLFDETVIHVTSEFDRVPNENLDGSGHNEQAHVSTFYSGIIEGPIVLGNIYAGLTKVQDPSFYGTIGNSAPVKELGNQKVGISNVSSTLSTLIKVKPIVGRSPSLVEVKDGKVLPKIERATNIEGDEYV